MGRPSRKLRLNFIEIMARIAQKFMQRLSFHGSIHKRPGSSRLNFIKIAAQRLPFSIYESNLTVCA